MKNAMLSPMPGHGVALAGVRASSQGCPTPVMWRFAAGMFAETHGSGRSRDLGLCIGCFTAWRSCVLYVGLIEGLYGWGLLCGIDRGQGSVEAWGAGLGGKRGDT